MIKILLFSVLASFAQNSQIDKCLKSCTLDADCGVGAICSQGTCHRQKYFCKHERWSLNERGEMTDCGAYSCSPVTGLCVREAGLAEHCTPGYVFDGKKSCIKSVNCIRDSGSQTCDQLLEQWAKLRDEYEKRTPAPHSDVLSCVACSSNSDCPSNNQMCWQKRCVSEGLYCQIDEKTGDHLSVAKDNTAMNCSAYACNAVTGACYQDCLTDKECGPKKSCVNRNCQ